MAKTITQLPDATSVSSSDEMIVQQSGITKRATVAEVMAGGAASLPAGTVISGSSASAALRVTQTGAGNALVIEDSANPDATPFVVTSNGTCGIGTSSPGQKLSVAGTSFVAVQAITSDADSAAALFLNNDARQWRIQIQGSDSDKFYFYDGTANATRMAIDTAGNVGIGTTAPNAVALLDVASTTKGFLPPRMTGAERDAISTPPAGLMVYNTTTNKLNFYNGTAWEAVTSS